MTDKDKIINDLKTEEWKLSEHIEKATEELLRMATTLKSIKNTIWKLEHEESDLKSLIKQNL